MTTPQHINPQLTHPRGEKGQSHLIQTIPSLSQAVWGGYFTFNVTNTNIQLHELILNFNLNAPVGLNASGGIMPYLTPLALVIDHIDFKIGSSTQIIDTKYGQNFFIEPQLILNDENRKLHNFAQGDYSLLSQRQTYTNTSGQNYYVALKSFIDQTHFKQYNLNHQLTLNVYLQPLVNVLNQGSYTGSVSNSTISINSCNLIVRYSNIPPQIVNRDICYLTKNAVPYTYSKLLYQSFTAQSGTSSITGILSNFTGCVSWMYFTVRPVSGLTLSSAYSYTPIANFALLDAGGSNQVGGLTIPSQEALTIFGKWWSNSSFFAEMTTPYLSNGSTNNNYVYMWSFSSNPVLNSTKAQHGNSHFMNGNDQLLINFPSALGSAVQIDVYASIDAYINQSMSNVNIGLMPSSNT